jgi:hypothetical protein
MGATCSIMNTGRGDCLSKKIMHVAMVPDVSARASCGTAAYCIFGQPAKDMNCVEPIRRIRRSGYSGTHGAAETILCELT